MPITNPTEAALFNANYTALGEYVNDGQRIPWFNSTALLVQPGEPLLVKWGAAAAEEVFLAQGPIRPGEIGYLIRPGDWVADFPATLTADLILGDEVYWDQDNSDVRVAASVTNGWLLGYAGYAVDPNVKNTDPVVDGNGRVKSGTSASTKVRVHSAAGATTTKGTVTIY